MLGQNWGNVKELTLNDVVVPNVGKLGGLSLTCDHIDTVVLICALMGLYDLEEDILLVKTRVLSKGSWDNKECISESLDSKSSLTRDVLFHPVD